MAIGDVYYEIMRFDATSANPDAGFLAKVTVEDPANYDITAGPDGLIKFTPKPAPPVVAQRNTPIRKYSTEHEGGLLRIRAVRAIPIHHVQAGDLGGLVSTPGTLGQHGDCWIAENARVMNNCSVTGDAFVSGSSSIEGSGTVSGRARVHDSQLNGAVYIRDNVNVDSCDIRAVGREVSLNGDGHFRGCLIRADESLRFSGGQVVGAEIRRQHELVSYWQHTHGWVSVYPDCRGGMRIAVGCQLLQSFEELVWLGRQIQVSEEDLLMLDAFINLAEVARTTWTPASKSAEAASDEVAAPVSLTGIEF